MNRFYSPDPYSSYNQCSTDYHSQRIKSSLNLHSALSLNHYLKQQKKKIGNYYYKESEQIGKGFSSRVYKAYLNEKNEKQLPQIYAIKVIPLDKSSLSSLQLLQNEIQILKQLDHPNVIKCYDIYKSKTHCYIVTQYCSGGCLMTYISKYQKKGNQLLINEEKIINIADQIIEGMKYLQYKSIVHRDIKPANILKGKNGWKIADFGFAILSNIQIKSKCNVGTPLYMPYESLTQNLYSSQSDIFSMGVIIYEMFTGTTPWQSKSEGQLIKKLKLIPIQLTEGRNKIPSQFLPILKKLCNYDKRSRMNKKQFSNFLVKECLHQSKIILNPQSIPSQRSPQYNQIDKQILTKRLRQNKSMDHIQILKQNQRVNIYQSNRKIYAGSIVVNKKITQDPQYKHQEKQKDQNIQRKKSQNNILLNIKQPFSTNSCKNQIFSSIKHKYFDIYPSIYSSSIMQPSINSPSIRASKILKKTILKNQILQTKKSLRLQFQQKSQKQELTKSTNEDKSQKSDKKQKSKNFNQKIQKVQKIDKIINFKKCSPITRQQSEIITHVLLNQIHFCRFLFYMYKNLSFILIDKQNQQKISILIFQFIFKILNQIIQLEIQSQRQNSVNLQDQQIKSKSNTKSNFFFPNSLLKIQNISEYIKSQKFKMIKKTINQYKLKYQSQFISLKEKLGLAKINSFTQKKNLFIDSSKKKDEQNQQNQNILQLKFYQNLLIQFLKECNYNLLLTIHTLEKSSSINHVSKDSFLYSPRRYRPNGFILTNIQGLKNLYKFYSLIKLLIEYQKDYVKFEKKSSIKVNIDYSKNITVSTEDFERLNKLIKEI